MTREQLVELDGFGDKSADRLLASIEKSKQEPLWRLINGLGIRHIGERNAQALAEKFGSLEAMMNATLEDFSGIPGIGEVLAKSAHDFGEEEHNRELVKRLTEYGLNVEEEQIEPEGELPLEGFTFVLTGKLETYTRPQAEAALRELGATVTGSVSKKTSAVIAGADAGSKASKAESLGIPILDENAIDTLLSGEIPAEIQQ